MTRRAQAEAVVAKLRSATMVYSVPEKQYAYEIMLVEAALAEHAKAAPVSDVGALVERLVAEARAEDKTFHHAYVVDDMKHFYPSDLPQRLADALISAQEEAAGLRVERDRLIEDRARFPDRPDDIGRMLGSRFEQLRAAKESSDAIAIHEINARARAESKLADAVGVLEKARVYVEMIVTDQFADTGTDKADLAEIDAFLTSIKETGDAR